MVDLRPGDCLLYAPTGVFGWVIATKTWHRVAHCEVYAGAGHSWASRDGLGVAEYPLRTAQLAHILRPTKELDLARANRWAVGETGTPYGWFDLANFVGIRCDSHGMFCSEFLVTYYRQAGWDLFPDDLPGQVAPFEFALLAGAGFDDIPLIDTQTLPLR